MNSKRYHIITYGCQMNVHDSEKLAGILTSLGYEAATDIRDASLIIFNTCCVREGAEERVFGNVGALKKRGLSDAVIAICGCMMQQEKVARRLMRTFPFVDIAFGTGSMERLPEMLDAVDRGERALFLDEPTGIAEGLPILRGEPPLAYISVMLGCDNFCSYCIVPYVRGRERSRLAAGIVREAESIVREGYKEIMLLGQNVNSYGRQEGVTFAELLRRVADTGIERIRFMTSHPKDISFELIDAIAEIPAVCPQLHLPVQSGSDPVLAAMNRKYTRDEYIAKAERYRQRVSGGSLTTDLIAGFPGETAADHEATLSLLRLLRFDAAFTFAYSPRSGTKAASMPDQIPEEEKSRRLSEIIDVQSAITEERNAEYVGRREAVLVESVSTRDKDSVCGRTASGKMVNFKGGSELIGRLVDVDITEGKRTTLAGVIAE